MSEKITLSEAVEIVFPKFSEVYSKIVRQWHSPYTPDKHEALDKMATFTNCVLKIVHNELEQALNFENGIIGIQKGQISTLEALKDLQPAKTLQGKSVNVEAVAESRENLMYMLGYSEALAADLKTEIEIRGLDSTTLNNRANVSTALAKQYDQMLKEWHRVYE